MSRPRQPRLLDRYELVQPLGAGGMAKVYLARLADPSGFDRHFALKLLESVDDPAGAEEQVLFRHEARVLGSLHHQHIAQIFDAGVAPDGAHYLVMEYVHGATLREVLEAARHAGRQLPLGFGLTVIAAAAAGLHHAHQRRSADGPMGIVHRDVSPSNLMIGHDGSVKLIDFGIAWSRNRSLETRRGIVRGKPGYMSPEQLMELPLDGRSDVFALGVVAYEATTQTRAFRASSEHETARRVVQGKVRSPAAARPGYPAELTELVMTALAPDPASRF
ncbi:MAG: serine/threonine protein kinase, partial [Myxococcales bacterium]|nr:serine/threonine protein kinase [Myxococcales bacterium]